MIHENKSVLVVDDVGDWQSTLVGMLTDAGFQVHAASSKEEALRLFRVSDYDLAVIDIRLDETVEEDTSGVTLARELKMLHPVVKIILITGYETRLTIAEGYAPGKDGQPVIEDYILKTRTDELTARVRELLAP